MALPVAVLFSMVSSSSSSLSLLLLLFLPLTHVHALTLPASSSKIGDPYAYRTMTWSELSEQTPSHLPLLRLVDDDDDDDDDDDTDDTVGNPDAMRLASLRDELARRIRNAQVLSSNKNRQTKRRLPSLNKEGLEDDIDALLQNAYGGPWVTGWKWTNSEPAGGGPISSDEYYCCPQHSLDLTAHARLRWRIKPSVLRRQQNEQKKNNNNNNSNNKIALTTLPMTLSEWTTADQTKPDDADQIKPMDFSTMEKELLLNQPVAVYLSYEVADNILGAVEDWHAFLQELRQLFDSIPQTKQQEEQSQNNEEQQLAALEALATRLLPLILKRTESADAWYQTFVETYLWGAEALQIYNPANQDKKNANGKLKSKDSKEDNTARMIKWNLAQRVICGRFESWVEPSAQDQTSVCRELGPCLMEQLPQEKTKKKPKKRSKQKTESAVGIVSRDGDDNETLTAVASRKDITNAQDGLTAWWTVRETLFDHPPQPGEPDIGIPPLATTFQLQIDGHAKYIASMDDGAQRRREEEDKSNYINDFHVTTRAQQMQQALEHVRALATQEEPPPALTFSHLQRLQQIILGCDDDDEEEDNLPQFRTGPAYAKGGREYYPMRTNIRQEFDDCLQQGTLRPKELQQSTCSVSEQEQMFQRVIIQAARLYLDVIFFHPFDNGNARLARLLLDYVLTQHDMILVAPEAVFAVSRSATDTGGLYLFGVTLALAVRRRGTEPND